MSDLGFGTTFNQVPLGRPVVYRLLSAQEALGLLSGLHRTENSPLERGGRVPRVPTALRLSALLGVTLERLLLGLEWSPAPLDRFPGPDGRERVVGGDGE